MVIRTLILILLSINMNNLQNSPSTVNTKSNITSVLYFWKIIFKDYDP